MARGVYWSGDWNFSRWQGRWEDEQIRLIPEVGKTLHSSNFINTYLLYTCYLFKAKLFHNCKWGISIRLKSKTNYGSAPAMRKNFRHENISGCCLFKKNFMAPFYGWCSTASMQQSYYEEITFYE